MKKTLLICGALLALTASIASAQGGMNLYWNDCGVGGGVSGKTFACNTNTGNHDIYASFDPPQVLPTVNGNNHIIDLQSAGAALPARETRRSA